MRRRPAQPQPPPAMQQGGFTRPFFQPVDPEDSMGMYYEDSQAPKRTEKAEAPVRTEDRPFG